MTQLYSMKQVCETTGLTYETLKFYCNQGLVPNVKRGANNRRVFDERDVEWVKSLTCLKRCDMSIQEMKEYLALCLQGAASIPERKTMLEAKRARLAELLVEVQKSIDYMETGLLRRCSGGKDGVRKQPAASIGPHALFRSRGCMARRGAILPPYS